MKIVLVSHDADFSGAPRVGFDIASALAADHDVTLVSKREGPLIELEKYACLAGDYIVTHTSHVEQSIPFNARVRHAVGLLDKLRPDLLYANSVGAAEWCVAARRLGIPSVLHTHEMEQGLRGFSAADVLKLDIPHYIDLLISASQEASDAFFALTSGGVAKHFLFGIAIESAYVKARAAEPVPWPVNPAGRRLATDKPVIAMCGTASARKGIDHFYDAARALPDAEFLWIGPVASDPTVKSVLERQARERPDNFFMTGGTPNPYAYIGMCDIFALTSVEDPNPLVVPEALTLGKRVVSFHNTGGSWQWTRRFGYALAGSVSAERLIAFLGKMLKAPRSRGLSERQASDLRDAVDLTVKLPLLRRHLSDLVGTPV
jgi:glycosyltransferase involved in cell wall biosynthesis